MYFDITVCGLSFYDIIYLLDDYPKERSDVRNPIVKKQFGGAFNTIKALRRVNKSLKIDVVTILGKDHIGNIAIKELKKNKVGTKNIIRSEQTNDDIILINQKNNSKTVFPRILHSRPKKLPQLKNTNWIHFMYLDNKEFLDNFSSFVSKKKHNQIFSADISNKKFKKTTLKKYLPFIDYLIFSTKELNSILEEKKCYNLTPSVLKKLKNLNKIVPNLIVHDKKKSIYLSKNKFIKYDYKVNIQKKLNILGAGDNYAAFILNELVTTGKITREVLKKAHYFASAYCLENKNI